MEAALWGFIGTVVGALASIGTTWLSGRHSLALQRHATSLDRIERGREFQRQNLLDLQDALHDAIRMVTRAHMEDLAAVRKGGTWGRTLLSDEVNEGVRLAQRKLTILIERVANDGLRAVLKNAVEATSPALLAKNQREAEAAVESASIVATHALEHIGRVLRSFY